jgi:hypothetical protein
MTKNDKSDLESIALSVEGVINFLPRACGDIGEKQFGLGGVGKVAGYVAGYTLDLLAVGLVPVVGPYAASVVAVASPILGIYKSHKGKVE